LCSVSNTYLEVGKENVMNSVDKLRALVEGKEKGKASEEAVKAALGFCLFVQEDTDQDHMDNITGLIKSLKVNGQTEDAARLAAALEAPPSRSGIDVDDYDEDYEEDYDEMFSNTLPIIEELASVYQEGELAKAMYDTGNDLDQIVGWMNYSESPEEIREKLAPYFDSAELDEALESLDY
jgi:predicted KAP-like P-loop ATPase